jgi:thiosulfate dehydrogenase (quinone) large subunit
MSPQVKYPTLVASISFGAARVALGILWLHEGIFKYTAHFGRADILLVAGSAKSNSRVPEYFSVFAGRILGSWPGLFGFVIPFLETALGVALVIGVLTLPAALASLLTLMTYWSSDQLIAQYPIMGILSAVVIAWSAWAARLSATTLIAAVVSRKQVAAQLVSGSLRHRL